MSDQYAQIFSALSQCTTDQLMIFRSYIENQLNRPTWNTQFLSISAPAAVPASVPSFSQVASEKPRDVVAVSKPYVAPIKQPTDWCTDESGDNYTYVCSKGSVCGCRYYPEFQTTPFSEHDKKSVNPICLHLYGLDPQEDFTKVRDHLISIIGEDASKSIFVAQGKRYGFITFKNHASATAAQKAITLYNECGKHSDYISVNFAMKREK